MYIRKDMFPIYKQARVCAHQGVENLFPQCHDSFAVCCLEVNLYATHPRTVYHGFFNHAPHLIDICGGYFQWKTTASSSDYTKCGFRLRKITCGWPKTSTDSRG